MELRIQERKRKRHQLSNLQRIRSQSSQLKRRLMRLHPRLLRRDQQEIRPASLKSQQSQSKRSQLSQKKTSQHSLKHFQRKTKNQQNPKLHKRKMTLPKKSTNTSLQTLPSINRRKTGSRSLNKSRTRRLKGSKRSLRSSKRSRKRRRRIESRSTRVCSRRSKRT